MRIIFTDGWNSFSHVTLGALQNRVVAFVFTFYQVVTDLAAGKMDFFIDMLEFVIGWNFFGINR